MSGRVPFLGRTFPVLGVVHLLPLPGAPGYGGSLDEVLRRARSDAARLADAGLDGCVVENHGDVPFWKGSVPPETVAALTAAALAVRDAAPRLLLGVNCLRNDALAALGVAAAVGAAFVRVNVLTGAMLTDQGLIEGQAAAVARKRAVVAPGVAVAADVLVKHAVPLAQRPPAEVARDTVLRGGADALIVTGPATGAALDVDTAAAVRRGACGRPVLAGSGVTVQNVAEIAAHVDGVLVGTALKVRGVTGHAVSTVRARNVVRAARAAARG